MLVEPEHFMRIFLYFSKNSFGGVALIMLIGSLNVPHAQIETKNKCQSNSIFEAIIAQKNLHFHVTEMGTLCFNLFLR